MQLYDELVLVKFNACGSSNSAIFQTGIEDDAAETCYECPL